MIKVIVIADFTLGKFNELKNIERANPNKKEDGHLYVNDIFECTEDMAKYLIQNNSEKRAFVKIIEVIPEEKPKATKKVEKVEENIEKEEKPKRVTRRKRSVAKK